MLYDMLSGFNEDSLRIYTGTHQPVSPPPDPSPRRSRAQPSGRGRAIPAIRRRGRTASVAGGPHRGRPSRRSAGRTLTSNTTDAETAQSAATPPESAAAPDSRGGPHPKSGIAAGQATHKPATPRTKPAQAAAHAEQASTEPEQDALVSGPEDADNSQTAQAPQARVGAHLGRDHVRRSAAFGSVQLTADLRRCRPPRIRTAASVGGELIDQQWDAHFLGCE